MRRVLAVVAVLALATPGRSAGILIPTEKNVPPLAMLNHQVNVAIEDQVAVTRIEQTFRNHTDRDLEATYVFPVPKGASVRKFAMSVDGKVMTGELVEADKARQIYTSIVQRTQDPGLLEYLGNNLFRLRVVPQAKKDLKISLAYTSVAISDQGLIEYVYPLKTDGKSTSTLEKFSINLSLKSQHPVQNIYSPTHAIAINRPNEREAVIAFEKDQALLDKDFQLFYTAGTKDVGLTALTHRPAGAGGYFMLLASPRADLSKDQQVPRDMILVLDTSGSMRGKRIIQARNALKYCLANLGPKDRFAMIHFATTVNKYQDNFLAGTTEEIERAKKWVDALEATGGTAIDDALSAALAMRTKDDGRTFTVVFFTDGRPTIGETNTDKILANVAKKNTTNTRLFTFGVGDDVNASMLDKLADDSRALSTYVRESEDIEVRVSSLFSKISNPVLANLKLTVSPGVSLSEVYPPQLPDLFHGSQLVILGRYTGQGHAAVKLTGNVGKETREVVYELNFPDKTSDAKNFVEDLWARRKVGYLLDQIRLNGEKKELVEEVVTLAKRYGITTPYTSYLITPDAVVPVARAARNEGKPHVGFAPGPGLPPALAPFGRDAKKKGPGKVFDLIKGIEGKGKKGEKDDLADLRNKVEDEIAKRPGSTGGPVDPDVKGLKAAQEQKTALDKAKELLARRDLDGVQSGRLGVDLSQQNINLRNQTRLTQTASRQIANRNIIDVGGVWIDETFTAKMPTVTVKALSAAYFRILEKQPAMKDVFRLSNHLVWVTPSGTALIVDLNDGRDAMPDADIDRLFRAPVKK